MLYECLDVVDEGPDVDHPGNRAIAVHVAMHLRDDDVQLLTLHRTVTAPKLEELRRGLCT